MCRFLSKYTKIVIFKIFRTYLKTEKQRKIQQYYIFKLHKSDYIPLYIFFLFRPINANDVGVHSKYSNFLHI